MIALSVLAACAVPADAVVLIKTIRVTICVTDVKHPDGCKGVAADGRVVVSEDALAGLAGELGQGATIMMGTGPAPAAVGTERRRRRHGDADLPPQ